MSAVTLDILGNITIDPHIDLGETVALTYGARRFVGPLIHLDGTHGPVLAVCACPAHGETPRLDIPLAPGDILDQGGAASRLITARKAELAAMTDEED